MQIGRMCMVKDMNINNIFEIFFIDIILFKSL